MTWDHDTPPKDLDGRPVGGLTENDRIGIVLALITTVVFVVLVICSHLIYAKGIRDGREAADTACAAAVGDYVRAGSEALAETTDFARYVEDLTRPRRSAAPLPVPAEVEP